MNLFQSASMLLDFLRGRPAEFIEPQLRRPKPRYYQSKPSSGPGPISYTILGLGFLLTIVGSAAGAALNDRLLMALLGLPGIAVMLGCLVVYGKED